MKTVAEYAKIAAIPLSESRLCLDCDVVHNNFEACPACGSTVSWPLAPILNRKEPVESTICLQCDRKCKCPAMKDCVLFRKA